LKNCQESHCDGASKLESEGSLRLTIRSKEHARGFTFAEEGLLLLLVQAHILLEFDISAGSVPISEKCLLKYKVDEDHVVRLGNRRIGVLRGAGEIRREV
jgi:hypothetical protein